MTGKLIPERLIKIREKLGINKTEAAIQLNMSKMGYGRYENGQREPSPQVIEFIAQRFGTTVDYLTGISDDPEPNYYVISKSNEPALFDFVTMVRNGDEETLKRLKFYYQELKKSSK